MEDIYLRNAKIMDALSTPMRMKIVDMLSCGELCAMDIQNALSLPQPSASYHMKLLVNSGIVLERNEGKYVFYSLNHEKLQQFLKDVKKITSEKESCICRIINQNC